VHRQLTQALVRRHPISDRLGGHFGRDRAPRQPGGRHFQEYTAFQVHRPEELATRQQHLRAAEEEVTRRVGAAFERKMKARQYARLGLRIEVHQRISAQQEIQARDRCVVDQIMTAEDHCAPQVGAEHVTTVRVLEVAFAQGRGNVFHVLLRIAREARLAEGLLVRIGGVNLHAGAKLVLAHQLDEQHGQAVGLLSGCTAR
jgi:hypothetical protein